MRIVLDTNVLVSGLINPKGIPAQILNLILNGKLILLYDNRILEEYENVLRRKKFSFTSGIVEPLIDFVKEEGIFIPADPLEIPFKDKDDKMFFEVAASGSAEYLITGNIVHFPEGEIIVKPKDFLDQFFND